MELLLMVMLVILDAISVLVKCFIIAILLIGLVVIAEMVVTTLHSLLKYIRNKWRYRDGTNKRRKRDN